MRSINEYGETIWFSFLILFCSRYQSSESGLSNSDLPKFNACESGCYGSPTNLFWLLVNLRSIWKAQPSLSRIYNQVSTAASMWMGQEKAKKQNTALKYKLARYL